MPCSRHLFLFFSALFASFITWMVHYYLFSHPGAVDMCINLCRSDAFMPQHGLYHTEVRTSFEKVCGKGVAEGMRAYILLDSGFGDKLFYHVEYHYARKRFLQPFAYEYVILVSRFYCNETAVGEICLQFGNGTWRYGHKPLFVALPGYTYELLVLVKVGHTQPAQFRYA